MTSRYLKENCHHLQIFCRGKIIFIRLLDNVALVMNLLHQVTDRLEDRFLCQGYDCDGGHCINVILVKRNVFELCEPGKMIGGAWCYTFSHTSLSGDHFTFCQRECSKTIKHNKRCPVL